MRLVHTSTAQGFALTRLVGLLLRDVVLTRDEVNGLMAGLLTSNCVPAGTTSLADWLGENAGNPRYIFTEPPGGGEGEATRQKG